MELLQQLFKDILVFGRYFDVLVPVEEVFLDRLVFAS